jgi:hypothetical protein
VCVKDVCIFTELHEVRLREFCVDTGENQSKRSIRIHVVPPLPPQQMTSSYRDSRYP